MVDRREITAMDRSSPGNGAESFLKILGLIDRTILPRRIFLANGEARLVLQVARGRAVLDVSPDQRGDASAGIAAAIAQFCMAGLYMTHRVEPASRAPAGFSSIAIVNAQGRNGSPEDGWHYRFSDDGWPLTAPPGASFSSLEAAARIVRAMLRWRSASGELLQQRALIVAIAEGLPREASIIIGDTFAVAATQPAQLGQVVSRWR